MINRNYLKRNRKLPVSDINVTPLIDVILVLLIIFMITAPMLVTGINVNLPEGANNNTNHEEEPIVITINKHGKVFIADSHINSDEIVDKLKAILQEKFHTRIFIRGDKSLPYAEIIKIMSQIQAGGFSKISLVTSMQHE